MNNDYYPKEPASIPQEERWVDTDEHPRRHRGVEPPSTYAPTWVEAPPEASGIANATEYLSTNLGHTTELLGTLTARLQPVLRPEQPHPEDTTATLASDRDPRGQSMHARQLTDLGHGAAQLSTVIRDLLTRIDLS